jgi:hypothetical protein
MRFSLRLLLGLIVLICLILGAREARRSFLWHRTLPIEFPLANANGNHAPYSMAAEVRFGKANADRVRAKASQQREKQATRLIDIFAPTESLRTTPYASVEIGPKLRPIYQSQLKAGFLKDPDLTKNVPSYLLIRWLDSGDPKAIDWVAEEIRQADPGRLRALIEPMNHSVTAQFLQDEQFHDAIRDYLRGPQVIEEIVDWAIGRVHFVDDEIAQILTSPERFVVKQETVETLRDCSGDQYDRQLAAENLLARLRLLGLDNRGITEQHAYATVRSLHKEVVTNRNLAEFRERSVVDVFQKATVELVSRILKELRAEARDSSTLHEFAEFVWQQNDFTLFICLADRNHQDRLDWLFRNREQLGFLDKRDPGFQVAISSNEQNVPAKFYEALPNARSGFDRPFDFGWLAKLLALQGPEFAQPRLLQLMREGVVEAYLQAGEVWKGTEDKAVLDLLIAKAASVSETPGAFRQIHKDRLYDSVELVSPAAVSSLPKYFRSAKAVTFDVPAGQLKDLADCFQRYGIEAEFEDDAWWVYWEVLGVLEANECGTRFTSEGPHMCESLLNASIGVFEPDVSVEEVGEGSGLYAIEVALDDHVYSFEINSAHRSWLLQLCDFYNHILEREKISERFFPTAEMVCFGEPELFEELKWRFDFGLYEGAEFYFPEKGRATK